MMRFGRLLLIAALSVYSLGASVASAATYTFNSSNVFQTGGTISFEITTPSLLSSDTEFTTFDNCLADFDGYTECTSVIFDFPDNRFGGTDPFLRVANFEGSAWYFFEDGAFDTPGTYTPINPVGTPCCSSSNLTATLVVSDIAPIPLPSSLLLIFSAVVGVFAFGRRKAMLG